jgi:hypothetical protein
MVLQEVEKVEREKWEKAQLEERSLMKKQQVNSRLEAKAKRGRSCFGLSSDSETSKWKVETPIRNPILIQLGDNAERWATRLRSEDGRGKQRQKCKRASLEQEDYRGAVHWKRQETHMQVKQRRSSTSVSGCGCGRARQPSLCRASASLESGLLVECGVME